MGLRGLDGLCPLRADFCQRPSRSLKSLVEQREPSNRFFLIVDFLTIEERLKKRETEGLTEPPVNH